MLRQVQMHWITVDTFTHPSNKSFFSIVTAVRQAHLILWYESKSALLQGDILQIDKHIISVNKGPQAITLLNTMPFTRDLWRSIRLHQTAPN